MAHILLVFGPMNGAFHKQISFLQEEGNPPMSNAFKNRIVPSWVVLGWLTCIAVAGCEPADNDVAVDAPSGMADDFAIDFDYTTEEMFDFDIEIYLQENADHLLPYAEMISHVAGEQRVSPRALIALMEQQSGAVDNPDFDASKPFGSLSEETGFLAQLRDVGSRLRGMGESAHLRVLTHSPQRAALVVLPAEELLVLGNIYQELFPGVVSKPKPISRATSQIPLQFPYPIGEWWYFGGTHSDNGEAPSSLDFNDNGEDWGDSINSYVVSSAAGTVKKHSSCYLTVIHADGWSTSYYHMSNISVATGAAIKANQAVGKYANTESQALCDGGWSTGPHVHWSLYKDNNEVSLLNIVLSGYSVHPGTSDYDDNCSRMWYTNVTSGKKVCPWTSVRNDGASAPVDNCPNDPNKTEPGVCGCGVAEGTCPASIPRIEMSKANYAVNESIVVRYYNLPGNSTDWVGIYTAGAANTAELQYVYSNGAVNGTMSFTGRAAGKYEARLFFNDSYTLEKKVSFTVGSTPVDNCPNDPNKTEPGLCGCGVAEGTCAKTYQAESYTSQSGCKLATNYTGYTGSGFMDYGGSGTFVEWNNINVTTAGSRSLTFRYANGSSGARQAAIVVNGVAIGNVAFSATGGWAIWKTATLTTSLRAGNNVIKVRANTSSGGPNLDSMDVK